MQEYHVPSLSESCNIPSPPTMTLPQANKYANPQPVRPAGKLQGNVKPLGILTEIPNSKKKNKIRQGTSFFVNVRNSSRMRK